MNTSKHLMIRYKHELMELFETAITVSHLSEPLAVCFEHESAEAVKKRMEHAHYDTLGVKSDIDNSVYGHVRRQDLGPGKCSDYVRDFNLDNLVSDSTSMTLVLEALFERSYMFILNGNKVSRIVTRADLSKPPMMMLLYSAVTALEVVMTQLIRKKFTDNSWQALISPNRLESCKRLHLLREKRNEEIDLIDCLQFCDKRDILMSREQIRIDLGLHNNNDAMELLKDIEDLRNRLAHAQDVLGGQSWIDVLKILEQIREMLKSAEQHM